MKQIEDYLHYYPGCQCMFGNTICKIVGSKLDLWDGSWNKVLFVELEMPNYNKDGLYYSFQPAKQVKPILHKMEDMSEQDALDICKLSDPGAFGDYRFSKWKAVIDPKSDKSWKAYDVINEKSDISWVIDLIDGDVNAYEDGNNIPTYNQHAITHFLLSKEYDLFNLITEGLAVDAKGITK